MRILIADDDVTSRLVLAGVLRKWDHEVVATVDGAEAWEAMRQPGAPRLAILDWVMPGFSGVEVCRRIRSLPSDGRPYLIILTSRGEKVDIIAGLEAGADDYLAKPFDPGELRARVGVGLRMIELQESLLEAHAALSHEASHDPLTGALNRRAFSEALSRALSDERRHRSGLALGICDVDQFKAVNDTHGHQVGDEVLCELVRVMAGALRGHDIMSRYGGDEFVVLATRIGNADMATLFERLRAAVSDNPIRTRAGALSVSVSFGATSWREGETEDELLAAADAALYRAKSAGRNRVVVDGQP